MDEATEASIVRDGRGRFVAGQSGTTRRARSPAPATAQPGCASSWSTATTKWPRRS
jgi:hypothetical protein